MKIDATYVTPVEHHNPMEPHATIARLGRRQADGVHATQGVTGAQATLAGRSGSSRTTCGSSARIVGGGFGCKGNTWPHATLAAMAART